MCVSDLCVNVCVCMCVCGGGGVGGGGGGRADEDLKTRTPHNDVGKKQKYRILTKKSRTTRNYRPDVKLPLGE